MLNQVQSAMSRMQRNIVINHPNSYEAVIVRKQVNRVGPIVGGLPTLGGLAVISSDDEEDFEWIVLGNAYAKLVNNGFDNAPMMDRQDANNGMADEFLFLIEPEIEEGLPGGFAPKKTDVMYLIMNDSVRLAYEIVSVQATSNIQPFGIRYLCNRRDDLHLAI